MSLRCIGGFKGEAGEALPPQIFLTLKSVVCIALKIIEIVATWCDILRLKGSKFDFGWGSAPDPARGARSAPRHPADPIPPGLKTTCLPKYVSLNPPMTKKYDVSRIVTFFIVETVMNTSQFTYLMAWWRRNSSHLTSQNWHVICSSRNRDDRITDHLP